MKLLSKILSVIVGLTVINVWLFRSGKSTSYRGGDANSLMEEFVVYEGAGAVNPPAVIPLVAFDKAKFVNGAINISPKSFAPPELLITT